MEKSQRIDLIKKMIADIHKKKLGEEMTFKYDKLENKETRVKFN